MARYSTPAIYPKAQSLGQKVRGLGIYGHDFLSQKRAREWLNSYYRFYGPVVETASDVHAVQTTET